MKIFTEKEKQELLEKDIDPLGYVSKVWFYDDSDDQDPDITSSLPEIKNEFDRIILKMFR